MSIRDTIAAWERDGTEGPWGLVEAPENYNRLNKLEVFDGVSLGEISPNVCNFGHNMEFYPTEGTPPSLADGNLMAAAPDMVKALKAAEELADRFEIFSQSDGEPNAFAAAYCAMQAFREAMG